MSDQLSKQPNGQTWEFQKSEGPLMQTSSRRALITRKPTKTTANSHMSAQNMIGPSWWIPKIEENRSYPTIFATLGRSPSMCEFPKLRGSNINPTPIALLVSGHLQKGPPICKDLPARRRGCSSSAWRLLAGRLLGFQLDVLQVHISGTFGLT